MLNSVNAARPNTPSLASLPRCPAHPTRLASVGGACWCVRGPTSGSLPPGASQVFENPMMSGPIRRNFARWIDATDRGHARLLTSAGAEPCGGSQECARARSALVRRSKGPRMRSKPMRGYLGGVREEIAISACDDSRHHHQTALWRSDPLLPRNSGERCCGRGTFSRLDMRHGAEATPPVLA